MRDDEKSKEQLLAELRDLRAYAGELERDRGARADKADRRLQKFLSLLLELAPAPIYMRSIDGHYLLVNQAWENTFQLPRDQVIGRLPQEIMSPETARLFDQTRHRVLANRAPLECEEAVQVRGERRVFRTVKFPLSNAAGQIEAVAGISIDITDQQQAHETLLATQERLRFLLSSTPAIIYTCQPAGDFGATFISENVATQLGYEAREFLEDSRFWLDRVHPDDFPCVLAALDRLWEEGQQTAEYRFRCRDGTYRWVHDQFDLVQDDTGEALEIIGFWIDVTERKRAEQALRESEIRFRAMIEKSWDGLSLVGRDGIIRYVSPGNTRTLGYAEGELVGRHIFDLVHAEDLPVVEALFAELLQHPGTTVGNQCRVRHQDGSWRYLEGTGTNLLSVPEVQAIVVNYHDITDRKLAQEKLQEYTDQLQTLSHRLMQAHEAERRHLARELHDEIG
ncbi:MAG: PAS domain S-box protein, partial [Planctomycetes bacterium]|nr:PAS domain S-box protein [Planctomycetota bacterium]